MYRHELGYINGAPGISHLRETPRASGLLVSEEIARTYAVKPVAKSQTASGIHLPDMFDVIATTSSRVEEPEDQALSQHSIECNDLNEFVKTGSELWRLIISQHESVKRIVVDLAEERELVDEEISTVGLIVPNAKRPEFKGYYAQADEIEALERMVRQVPVSESTGYGMYL